MRSIIKKYIRSLLLFFLVAALVSCSRNAGRPSDEPEKQESVAKNKGPAEAAKDGKTDMLSQVSKRGPGMKGSATDWLKLRVPRTFDLTHVDPAHFAVALGKDPHRIFEFVRDHIGYEVYTGCLRGPRGTLLAMAGNSVDRAALLANLLEESGQRVRYARGTLPEVDAKELVLSMWAERPRPVSPRAEGEPSPAVKAAIDTLVNGINRDYQLIRDHLKKMDKPPAPAAVDSLEALVKEAQAHYWVQWFKDGMWVDLDPSFADAAPGRTYAKPSDTFQSLPDAVFHRVEIRIKLEEYAVLLAGNAESKRTTRQTLKYTAKARDLSGLDLVLTHQPENWKGPAKDIKSAISAAAQDTGRVKPVLIIGREKWVAGEAFRQKLPTGRGVGGIGDLLGGAGARKAVEIATAESIEVDFINPGGRKKTLVRGLFDLVGEARRHKEGHPKLSPEEVRTCTDAKTAFDVTDGIYGLFLTTGRIDASHLSNVVKDPAGKEEPADDRPLLRRVNLALAATSDMLLRRLREPERVITLFYPDSPRLQVIEISTVAGAPRLALDLRRDHARAVAIGPHLEDVFDAWIFRGVVDATLERILSEFITGAADEKQAKMSPVLSTSSLFERMRADGVRSVLLTREHPLLGGLAENTYARVRKDLTDGYLLVAPERAITLGKEPRFAWWRIDPRSGETTAVTDEGLHGTAVCYTVQTEEREGQTVTVVRIHYRAPYQLGRAIPGQRVLILTDEMMEATGERIWFMLQRLGIPYAPG